MTMMLGGLSGKAMLAVRISLPSIIFLSFCWTDALSLDLGSAADWEDAPSRFPGDFVPGGQVFQM
jgi:hypothetical protein